LNPAQLGFFLLCFLLRRLCFAAQWLCFAQGSGFAGFGAQALPGSVRVRFGLKKRVKYAGL
jgi:hypothetical protein